MLVQLLALRKLVCARLDLGLSLLTQPRRAKRSNAANNCPTEGSKRWDGCGIHGCVLLDCSSAEIGTRSKRNFHRPQSNCGMPLNSGWRVFIVVQPRLRLQIQAPRRSRDSVPQTRKKHSTLTLQEADFFSCYSFKHLKVEISQKRE